MKAPPVLETSQSMLIDCTFWRPGKNSSEKGRTLNQIFADHQSLTAGGMCRCEGWPQETSVTPHTCVASALPHLWKLSIVSTVPSLSLCICWLSLGFRVIAPEPPDLPAAVQCGFLLICCWTICLDPGTSNILAGGCLERNSRPMRGQEDALKGAY